MSNYVFRTSLRYQDYLQAKNFEDSLRSEISSSTRRIIATNEELARDHIAVLESVSSAVSSGFEQLSFETRALSGRVDELNSTFRWGLSETLTLLSGISDSLHELKQIAKNRAQAWAYEQFEIARDAFRRRLYDEALQYLNRAINGYGDETGYNLEYRFHYLLGTIRMGSFRNSSDHIIDLPQAEQAFLSAARYAWSDYPKMAAQSLLAAGWAAYCRGHMRNAERHTREAIALDGSLAEAHFQLAKVLMHEGKPEAVLSPLKAAIMLDRGYAVKACTDGDFTRDQQTVKSFMETLRHEAGEQTKRILEEIDAGVTRLESDRAVSYSLAGSAPIDGVRNIAAELRRLTSDATIYGYLEALPLCEDARSALNRAPEELRNAHFCRLQSIEYEKRQQEHEKRRQEQAVLAPRIARSERARGTANMAMWCSLASILCFIAAPVGVTLGIIALTDFSRGHDQKGKAKAIVAVVVGGLMLVFYGLLIVLLFVLTSQPGPQRSINPPWP